MSLWKTIAGTVSSGISSILTYVGIIDEHLHNSSAFLYPELADPILVTKEAGAWAGYPATKTEIIPAGAIALPFDLHFIHVTNVSLNGNYTFRLYKGLAGAEVQIHVDSIERITNVGIEIPQGIFTEKLPAGTRISIAISSANATADTLRVKLKGHTY